MATQTSRPAVRERGPPAEWLFHTVINPLMTLLLRSPLHGLVSDSLMLIKFTGRRSGQEYTTPVGYHRVGDELAVFTHSDWWRNMRGGASVSLLLRGEWRTAEAVPVEDRDSVASYILQYIDEHGLDAARRIGLEFDGDDPPSKQTLIDGIYETVVIEFTLEVRTDA